jgi:hypothetical protein
MEGNARRRRSEVKRIAGNVEGEVVKVKEENERRVEKVKVGIVGKRREISGKRRSVGIEEKQRRDSVSWVLYEMGERVDQSV